MTAVRDTIGASQFVPAVIDDVATEIFSDVGFGVALFDDRNRELHELSSGAAAIWILIDGRASISDISSELQDVFGLASEVALAQVHKAVGEFWAAGLLVGSPIPLSAQGSRSEETESTKVLPRPPDP